jgi:integrase
MQDLVLIDPATAGALSVDEIDATMQFAQAEKSASTRAAYAGDWRDFAIWCHAKGATPLPAHVGIVGAYLSHLANSGLRSSTIGRKCAAIADRHKAAGLEPPTASEAVKAVMRGIRRTIGTSPERKSPITAEVLTEMLKHVPPDSLVGLRDRALLTFGFATAMRRSELCALEVGDLTETPDGLRVTIRRSKTDQTGEGQEIAVPRGFRLRPVEAVQAWLAAAELNSGKVFRSVASGDRVGEGITPECAVRRLKVIAVRAGLDPALFAGHSLRSGYVTSAVEVNAPLLKIAEQTRHRSLDMLRVYSRRVDLFREHSGAAFL